MNLWRPGVVVVGMDASVDPLDDLPDPADVPACVDEHIKLINMIFPNVLNCVYVYARIYVYVNIYV